MSRGFQNFFWLSKVPLLRGFKVATLSGYFVSLSLSRLFVLFGSLLSHSRPFASWSAVCCKTLTSPAISRSQFTTFFDKVFMLTLHHFAGPAQRFVGFSFPFCVFIISQDFHPVKTFFYFFLGASQFVLFQSPTGRSYLFITRSRFYSAFACVLQPCWHGQSIRGFLVFLPSF